MEYLEQILVIKLYNNNLHEIGIETFIHIIAIIEFPVNKSEQAAIKEAEESHAHAPKVVIEGLHDGIYIGRNRDINEILKSLDTIYFYSKSH